MPYGIDFLDFKFHRRLRRLNAEGRRKNTDIKLDLNYEIKKAGNSPAFYLMISAKLKITIITIHNIITKRSTQSPLCDKEMKDAMLIISITGQVIVRNASMFGNVQTL